MFPVWLGFRGGKGVATALGVLIALAWPVALVAAGPVARDGACCSTIPRSPRWSPRWRAPCSPRCVVDKPTRLLIAAIALLVIAAASREYPPPDRRHRKPDLVSAKAEARPGRTRTRSAGAPRLAAAVPHRDDRPGHLLSRCCAASARPARRSRRCRSSRAAASAPRPCRAPAPRPSRTRRAAPARRAAGLLGRAAYPSALAAIEDAPPSLTVLGRAELLRRPIVAVVGARNASANGRRLRRDLAAGLGRGGIVVVSGMARGIDAAAHLGALDTGSVAVVAGGVDVVYPRGEPRPLRGVRRARRGSSPNCRSAPSRRRGISRAATGSSRGWRSASSWSRRRRARAR